MKTFRVVGMALLAVVMSINFIACDSDDENENGNWAPETLEVGNTIAWNGTYISNGKEYSEGDNWFTILDEHYMEASWSNYDGNYKYTATSPTTADLRFSVRQIVGSNDRTFIYNCKLEFTGKNKFIMTGSKLVSSSMTGTHNNVLNCNGVIK